MTRIYYGVNKEKGDEETKPVRANPPPSTGRLGFLFFDLADLSTISTSAKNFLERTRLDVNWTMLAL